MSYSSERLRPRRALRFLAAMALACLALTAGEAGAADLGIVKAGGGNVAVGATVTFTLSASTVGTLTLPAGVPTTVTDTLPAMFTLVTVTSAPGWNCSASSGQLVSCTRSAAMAANSPYPVITVTAKATAPGAYSNCASVAFIPNSSTQPDLVPGNNTSCVGGVIGGSGQAHNVQIKKSVSGPVAVGGNVTFTLKGFNIGPGSVGPGQMTITDPLLPGFSFVSAGGPGWTCGPPIVSCTYSGTVAAGGAFPPLTVVWKANTPGTFNNCANAIYNGTPGDTDPSNNQDCAKVTVTGAGLAHDVKITKTTYAGSAHVGYQTAFSLNPVNVGPGPISSSPPGQVTITDTMPPGFVVTTLGSGPDWSCTQVGNPVLITCTYVGTNVIPAGAFFPQIAVVGKPTIAGPYVNSVHIQYNLGPDTNPADNTSSVSGVVLP